MAFAEPGNGQGNANGVAGCTTQMEGHFDNPSGMIKALQARPDGLQGTVQKYDFGSVGNLINEKCGS